MRRHNGENRCSHANMLVTRCPAHLATFFCVCAWPQYDAQPAIAGARAAAGARIRVHDEGSRAAEAGRAIGRAAISAHNGGQAYQVRACTRAVHLSAAAAAPAALAQLPLVRARGSTERPLQTDRPRYGSIPFVRSSAAAAAPFPAKPLPGASRAEAPTQSPGHSLPMTPSAALKLHLDTLSDYERGEILEYTEIYCTGDGADKVRATLMASEASPNHGAAHPALRAAL